MDFFYWSEFGYCPARQVSIRLRQCQLPRPSSVRDRSGPGRIAAGRAWRMRRRGRWVAAVRELSLFGPVAPIYALCCRCGTGSAMRPRNRRGGAIASARRVLLIAKGEYLKIASFSRKQIIAIGRPVGAPLAERRLSYIDLLLIPSRETLGGALFIVCLTGGCEFCCSAYHRFS